MTIHDPGAELRGAFDRYRAERGLETALSFEMPPGFESASGMFDPESNTVFFNAALLADAPAEEQLFYLLHELRHAEQYLRPERFGPAVAESMDHVIQYDGLCFKRVDGAWRECRLPEQEEGFAALYLGQPHELDANRFALRAAEAAFGPTERLGQLRDLWIPALPPAPERYREIYRWSDRAAEP